MALLMTLALLAGLMILPAAADNSDVEGHWAQSSIERWLEAGVVQGSDTGFEPNDPLIRGQYATILVNLLGLTETAPNTYRDLTGDEWYADAILKCTAAGIMQGDGINCNATSTITRQETTVMTGRALGVEPVENPNLSAFNDGAQVADWAAPYVAAMAQAGIITGLGDGTVAPTVDIDRASTMALLDKAVVTYITAPGEYKLDAGSGFVIVNVPAKDGEVVLTGAAAGVVVAAGTESSVVAKDLTADTVKLDNTGSVSIEGKSDVGALSVNAEANVEIAKGVTADTVTLNAPATVTNNGTVAELTANAEAQVTNNGTVSKLTANEAVKVDNKGTITKAEIKSDNVILDGKKPSTVDVADGTKNPTTSSGTEVKDNTGSIGGGGGGGGGHTHSWTVTKAATCTTDGVETCSYDNVTRPIKAQGHQWETDTDGNQVCSVCKQSQNDVYKFNLKVESGASVNAVVFDDYSAIIGILKSTGDNGNYDVSAASVTVSAKMKNVASLGVGEERSHSITVNTNLSGSPSLATWLNKVFEFTNATVNGKIDGNEFSYEFSSEANDPIVYAKPTDIEATRTAWQALTAHVKAETQTPDDSFILIKNGCTLQIGTELLSFEGNGDLTLNNVNDLAALETAIRNAVKLETEAADSGHQVKIVLKAGTVLAVGGSKATLQQDATITIDGLNMENTQLGTALSTLRDSKGTQAIAKNLVNLVNQLVGAVNGQTNIEVNITFATPSVDEGETGTDPAEPTTPPTDTTTPADTETPTTTTPVENTTTESDDQIADPTEPTTDTNTTEPTPEPSEAPVAEPTTPEPVTE